MSDAAKTILIVGGSGRHGGTGAFVARRLLDLGYRVRAMTRRNDGALSRHLPGAEVVVADLHDRRSLIAALDSVEVAYFTYPIAGGIVDAAANFSSAARVAGLKRLVVMSMGAARPDSASHLGRAQWLAEELLETSGFDCIQLRIVALFFENLEMLHRHDILGDGVIRNSFPDLAVNWIAGADAGRLAVAALIHPERFGAKSAVYPSGKEKFSHAEVARTIGDFLGRDLRHETISADAWRHRLLDIGKYDDRINDDMARHISAIGASTLKPFAFNNLFETATEEPPMRLAEALSSGYLTFAQNASSANGA